MYKRYDIDNKYSVPGITYMPTASIFEHSGNDEAPDKSARYESLEETDSNFFHASYTQACPVHDIHRCLKQTRELTESKELHGMQDIHQTSVRTRLFFYKQTTKDIERFDNTSNKYISIYLYRCGSSFL